MHHTEFLFDKHTSDARVASENANLILVFMGLGPPSRQQGNRPICNMKLTAALHNDEGKYHKAPLRPWQKQNTAKHSAAKVVYIVVTNMNMPRQVTFVILRLPLPVDEADAARTK